MSLPDFLHYSFFPYLLFGSVSGLVSVLVYFVFNKIRHRAVYRYVCFMIFVKWFFLWFCFSLFDVYTSVIEPSFIKDSSYYSSSDSLKSTIFSLAALFVMIWFMLCVDKSTRYESEKYIFDHQPHQSDDATFPSNEARLYPLIFACLIITFAVFLCIWLFSDPLPSIRFFLGL
ncbi:MAG: hypothetical protein ACI4WX_11745 [Aristaeellaceae bacterium]